MYIHKKAQNVNKRNYFNTEKHLSWVTLNILSIIYGKRKLQSPVKRYDMDVEVGRYAAEMAQSL